MSTTTIRRGSTGAVVARWQDILNASRAEPGPTSWRNTRGQARTWPAGGIQPLEVDGKFGPLTELATEAWQIRNGLTPDGIVGPKTWGAALGGTIAAREPLLYGTDVSTFQGTITEKLWATLRDQGIRFAIMRTCVGNEAWIDKTAVPNIEKARAQGIAVGAYFFSYPLRHIDPVEQVNQWAKRCELAGLELGELACALDMEWPPREEYKTIDGVRTLTYPWKKWGVTAESIAEWNLAALERCRAITGQDWLRYSYRYWLQCIESQKYGELASGPLWLADYITAARAEVRWPTPDEVAKRKPPAPWSQISIFQIDGNGGLRLPNGVDADFNVMPGGEAALARLFSHCQCRVEHVSLVESHLEPAIMPDEQIASYRLERLTSEPAA